MNTPKTIPTPVELCTCHNCESEMVYPTRWEESDPPGFWIVQCRCPNCEVEWSRLIHEDAVDGWDALLDKGTDQLVRDLRNRTYANMAEEIHRFIGALNADALLPEDFGRPA